jgi:DNA-directed RNA polymerase specialized sigma24 family protein
VLQETFLAVWKGASAYRPRGTAQAWMWVIARNRAARLLRRRSTRCSKPGEPRGPGRSARPPADRGAWICASVVFAVGLLLFTIRGPRTRLSDDS